jgi:alpha-beta hydrolase superfamily lysophospholipase
MQRGADAARPDDPNAHARSIRTNHVGVRASFAAMRLLLLLLGLVVLASGCGGGTSESTAGAGPSVATECGDVPDGLDARGLWLHTSDGVRLYAATTGDGDKAVVLLHESPANLCGWLDTMKLLADHGFRAVAIDFRGWGRSTVDRSKGLSVKPDIEAAVEEAKAEGSDEVFLMGASYGGAAELTYGPDLDVDGIVSLSGELELPYLNAIGAVPRLKTPLLVVAGRDDGAANATDAHKLVRAAGSRDKRAAVFPGEYHGWALLDDAPYGPRAQRLVLDWLDAR